MRAMMILLFCLMFACMGMSDCASWWDYDNCEDHEVEITDEHGKWKGCEG